VGSGGEFAMGAMAAGANARKAVSIACQLDYYTGKGIDTVKVKP
jgi:ATP-dependent protease HslVU (ClpYQ) peptidase subunit